jgi:3-oxoacyl-[acyl-carrier-protein] synthase II
VHALGRASQFAIAASRLALEDGGIDAGSEDCRRIGVVIGTTSGEPHFIEALDDALIAGHPEAVDRAFVRGYPGHLLAAHVAAEFRLRGVALTIATACAAGNGALAYASDAIRSGALDLALAGGADVFSRITYTGFSRLGAIAPERCQPFDLGRKGMIPGEGAGILLLEAHERAVARGARIYAELAGYGLSCDAHHMTSGHPAGDGAVRAMQMALASAELAPADVSYISAHGTGTLVNDRLETVAIKRAMGRCAYDIPVSSIKSMLGHAMGAASAIEAAACALAVSTDRVPPTVNLETPDPACDLDYVPNVARAHRVTVALNNAYAFGGTNACVLLRKWEDAA